MFSKIDFCVDIFFAISALKSHSSNACDGKLAPVVYVLDLLPRTIGRYLHMYLHLGFTQCIAHKNDSYNLYSPDRARQCRTGLGTGHWAMQECAGPGQAAQDWGGKGSVRQCRDRQDRVDPGWVGHSRIGRIRRGRASLCKAGQDQAVSDRAGQDSARQAGSGQRQPGQGRSGFRTESRSTGQEREGPRMVGQCRTDLVIGQAPVPGMVSRTGQGQDVQCYCLAEARGVVLRK